MASAISATDSDAKISECPSELRRLDLRRSPFPSTTPRSTPSRRLPGNAPAVGRWYALARRREKVAASGEGRHGVLDRRRQRLVLGQEQGQDVAGAGDVGR